MPEQKLTFTACVALAAANPDSAFCEQDLPLLEQRFREWATFLRCERFEAGAGQYICIYFPDWIETEITEAFQTNPTSAWSMSSLAWSMLRLRARLELGAQACLPLPPLTAALQEALARRGLCAAGRLSSAFALLTFFPVPDGCGQCALQADCPRLTRAGGVEQ